MAISRSLLLPLLRSPKNPNPLPPILHHRHRSHSTSATPSHHNDHINNHTYLPPNPTLNTWSKTNNNINTPKQALSKLAGLRREYAKKVKAVRKEYIEEMEVMRVEKMRRDEVKKEALRVEGEERRAAKSALKMAKAAEREVAQEEFRLALLKERAEKLEYHKMRENKFMEKKNEKAKLLRSQSSLWIDEAELEAKILEAIIDHQ